MAKSFRTLRDKMAPEWRKQNEQRTTEMLVEIALQDLRKSLHLTQEQVAEMMQMNQAAISKMERQNDIYVSTLRRFVSALGGELKLVASFPDKEVVISQFD
jgi:transcriptional regulator with XRE-family HTH domain